MSAWPGYVLSRGGYYKEDDLSGPYFIDSAGVATPLGGGGGGSGGTVEVSNFPATQPVSGTVAVTGIATAGSTNTGATNAAAYTDATGAAVGTMIALLKGIYVQQATMIGLLNDIKTNTTPTPP